MNIDRYKNLMRFVDTVNKMSTMFVVWSVLVTLVFFDVMPRILDVAVISSGLVSLFTLLTVLLVYAIGTVVFVPNDV